MDKSINMVWGPHIARVKTKNVLNLRIGLFKNTFIIRCVNSSPLRTDYLRGPLFALVPPVGGFGMR